MKRYKVVQDARGHWGIWDREADDFASWGSELWTGADDHFWIFRCCGDLNQGDFRDAFEWDGEYLPREKD